MNLRKTFAITASTILLSACASTTTNTAPAARPAGSDAALATSVGIDAATAERNVDRKGFNNAVNVGLAASATRDFGGLGLGFGLLNVLTDPGAGIAGSPNLILDMPPAAATPAFHARLAEAILKASGDQPEAQGYRRLTSPPAYYEGGIVFIRDGCQLTRQGYFRPECSKFYRGKVFAAQSKGATGHFVQAQTSRISLDYETFARRIVQQMPGELSLYLPPRKVAGVMQPARILRRGTEQAL